MLVLSAHDSFWIVNPLFSGDLLLVSSTCSGFVTQDPPPKKNPPNSVFFPGKENGYEKRITILTLEIQRPFFLEWYCRKDCSFSKG